jgi:hypothetical protein
MSWRDVKKKTVVADLDIAFQGIDAWNEHLSELVGEGDLLGIHWEVVGAEDGGIVLQVTGHVEDEE